MASEVSYLVSFLKYNRLKLGLTQLDIAAKAGVGLRFVRDMEQGKKTLRMDKVNQVLSLFGTELLPGHELNCFKILEENYNKPVKLSLKNKQVLKGELVDYAFRDNKIFRWVLQDEAKATTNIYNDEIEAIENI